MAPLTMQELDDLSVAMMERMGTELLPALTRANRMGELEALFAGLGMSDLLGNDRESKPLETGKIIVLGASQVPVDRLRKTASACEFDPDRFEFHTDYDRLKHFVFGKIRGSMGYVAIFAGPMPHKTPGRRRQAALSRASRTIKTTIPSCSSSAKRVSSKSPRTASRTVSKGLRRLSANQWLKL